ncbi:hypothetical protein JOM56_015546 [Amanita muscaria]
MPPKLQLMPGLRMTTRASNKDKHPGSILVGNPRRSSEEMNQLREEAAAQREAEEERLTVAIKNVAQIEDKLRGKDNELELERRRRREELRAEGNKSRIGSSIVVAASGKENKSDGVSSNTSKKSQDASKRLQRAVTTNGKGKAVVDEEESSNVSNNWDPDYEKPASGSEADKSATGDNTDSEVDEASDASETEAKKRKRSNSRKKKVKQGREDVRAMRTNPPSNATSIAPLNNKRKAVPDGTGPETHKSKKRREDDTTGLDPEWADFIKKHGKRKQVTKQAEAATEHSQAAVAGPVLDEESCVRYGGFIGDNEDDTAEASAVGQAILKPKKNLYPSIRIQNNAPNEPKTMKEARGGDERWKEKHLPEDSKQLFKEEVLPRIRQLLGALEPWAILTHGHVQNVLDQVFGEGKYSAVNDKVFYGLAKMRIENWRNGFSKAAVEAVQKMINDNAEILATGAARKEFIAGYLLKVPVGGDGEYDTHAYQWAEWKEDGAEKKGFGENSLVLYTFANAHLAQIQAISEDVEKEKPIGALLMSMQAVGRALEIWIDGDKSLRKPPAFSYDNYGDTFAKIHGYPKKLRKIRRATFFVATLKSLKEEIWKRIINLALENLDTKENVTQNSASNSGADEIEDPNADFVMVV